MVLENKNILYLENDESNFVLVRNLFLALNKGYKVFRAESKKEVFELLKKYDIKLVLIDIHLKKLFAGEGYIIAKKIKEHEEYKKIPLVGITADKMNKEFENPKVFVDFFYKPIRDLKDFRTRLEKLT